MITTNEPLCTAPAVAAPAIHTNETDAPSRVPSGSAVRLTFAVSNDRQYFVESIPAKVQTEVNLLLEICRRIHESSNKAAAIRAIAALPENRSRKGFSESSLGRKYYAYAQSGDWRDLVNRAKAPAEKVGLPLAFAQFFKKLCGQNQRCCSQAMRDLLIIWRTRHTPEHKLVKAIPGYAEWPVADPRTGVPEGWTERNLYRYIPDAWSLKAARTGRAAASQLRLKVYRTRVGLAVGEFYQFDDHEYDLKVNFPGQRKAMRPRGFSAIDVLSGSAFAKSFKPTLWDEANEKKQALTERDMMWFVIHVLCEYGYRDVPQGTALCVEHGTAAIRGEFEDRIIQATGGNVRIERSGKFGTEGGGRLALHNQFNGAPKGNFRFKALIENFWNIINNYLAALPGQVGKDRDHSPEQLHGAEAYNNRLLKLETVLPAEVAAQLRKPFYSWNEFLDAALRCYTAIDHAASHELEGWEACGFDIQEWRLNEISDWLPQQQLLTYPKEQRTLAMTLINANDNLLRRRRLSRAEAFARGRELLTPLPAYEMPTLMGEENALRGGAPIVASSGVFAFENADMGPGEHRYKAVDEFGGVLRDKYICFVNPFSPSVLVACDAKLRVKAICRPVIVSAHNDRDSINRGMGEARKWETDRIAEFESRHADAIQAKAEMHEHNGNLLAGRKKADEPELTREERDLSRLADEAILKNYNPGANQP